MNSSRLRAILFDLDGTLADTEPSWLRAKATVAQRYGIPWTVTDGLASIGQATRVYSGEFARRGADASVEQIADEITAEVARSLADQVLWRPGALDLLGRLVTSGIRTGLVTMAYRPVAEALALATRLPVFDVIVAGDDVIRPKPHPEPYMRALEALGLTAAEAIAVEDTSTGAASARAAGLRTVVVPSDDGVTEAPGLRILHGLSELVLDDYGYEPVRR